MLLVDNAGWHTNDTLDVSGGGEPAFLPASSPEQQPAERLWGLIDESVANRAFASPIELEDALAARGERQPPAVASRGRYRRWPHERRPRNTK